MKVKLLSRVGLLATPWTAAHQSPPSMGFSRQEYWSGVPLPSPITRIVIPKREPTLFIYSFFFDCDMWIVRSQFSSLTMP